jgi:ubiquinone/menaquinone biosynthesis C-methylase UbiE
MVSNEYNKSYKFWERQKPKIQSDFLVRPYVIKLAGDVKEKRILDAGCGEGYISRILARKGGQIIGVDNSLEMINIAKRIEEKEKLGIRYEIANVLNLTSRFKKEKFDLVVSVLVFPYFNKNNLVKAIKQTYTVLKKGGEFILAIPHPFLYVLKPKTNWVKFLYNKFNYFDSTTVKIRLFDKNKKGFSTDVYHNTLYHFINSLLNVGFQLIKILETRPSKKDLKTYPYMWGEENRVPFYLIIKAKKL